MFTGLIQSTGKVIKFAHSALWVRSPFRRIQLGESISVNGVCLTVAARRQGSCRFDVGPGTARLTTLSALQVGESVNLERALRVGDAVGGHWVTGHVEGTGRVEKIQAEGKNLWLDVRLPIALMRYVVHKGSITIDGISLTVAQRRRSSVRIMIIPFTLSHTTLSAKRIGNAVNIETDYMTKIALAAGPRQSRARS